MSHWLKLIFGDSDLGSVLWTIVDVGIVFYVIYRALLLIKGTRAVQMLVGLTLIILLFFVSKDEYGDLPTLNWLLDKVISSFIFIIIVIFQKDIRRALVEVGKNPILSGGYNPTAVQFYEEVIRGAVNLASKRLGAVIVIERETDLSEYAQQGVTLDAEVTKELLFCVFIPQYQNPLHDGALLIQKGKATAASCYLPLSDDPRLERSLGSRHRAAVGISEETDAVVIVVSEETGTISIAVEGRLMRGLDANSLRAELQKLLSLKRSHRRRLWSPFGRRFRRPRATEASPGGAAAGVADAGAADAGAADGSPGPQDAPTERRRPIPDDDDRRGGS
jgi:uncharacterized protein (TIGR00159 family)